MERKSPRRKGRRGDDDNNEQQNGNPNVTEEMRKRNRAIAEREASRLARPERRNIGNLKHASIQKSAVSSTPFGFHAKNSYNNEKEEEQEWCGPFSVARQMIAKREEARRKREEELEAAATSEDNKNPHPLDAILEEVDNERKRKAHPSLQWKGQITPERSEGNIYSKRQKRLNAQQPVSKKVASLYQICVDFVVTNFEHVEALGNIDSTIRRTICSELVAKKKLNCAAFDTLVEAGMEALEVIDCAEVTQEQLTDALNMLMPAGLRYLLLHHSGRCFGVTAVNAIKKMASMSQLFALSIGGAYLVQDDDASTLLGAIAKNLSSIEFKACPNLGPLFCNSLATNFSSTGGDGTLLELSFEDLELTKDDLLSLTKTDAMRNIKSLAFRSIEQVDDEVITSIFTGNDTNLESIDLTGCIRITDVSLSAIRQANKTGMLRSLILSGLKNLTNIGLETFFTPSIPGLPSPPMLRKLDLSSCGREVVTDEVMDLICKASSIKRDTKTGEYTLPSSSQLQLSSMGGGLVHVNINGSNCSDTTMEYLAATSVSSLKELDISYAPFITDKGLGYLVSKVGNQFNKIKIWGCAQINEEFLDGHSRIHDPNLQIIGAWIKKR